MCNIYHKNESVFLNAYGYLNNATYLNDSSICKVNKTSKFDLASVTKIFISTLILHAITKKEFKLSSKIIKLLPAFFRKQKLRSLLESVTVEELLTHSSGLIAWYPFYAQKDKDFFDILGNILNEELPKDTVYSDLNFMLLGKLLEHVYQMDLADIIKQEYVKPFNMSSLSYGPIIPSNVAATEFGNQTETKMCEKRNISFSEWRPTDKAILGEVNDGNCYYYFSGQSGHAGLFANAEDVVKLGRLYLQKGVWNGEEFISQELVEKSMEELGKNRGLGWDLSDLFPYGCGHTGFTGPSMWVVPENEIVVVTLTNRLNVENPKSINEFRKKLHQIVIDEFIV